MEAKLVHSNQPSNSTADAIAAQEHNRQNQLFLDQIAQTPYGKERIRLLTKLNILNQTHVRGKFTNSDAAIKGITEWIKVNPCAEIGDLLDTVRNWLIHAKKDESTWSADSKIFTTKLEDIMWGGIVAFIRLLDAKEMNRISEKPAAGTEEANKLLQSQLDKLKELEADYKQTIALQKQTIDTLQKEHGALTSRTAEQKQEIETFRAAKEQSLREVDSQKHTIGSLQAERTTLLQQITELKAQLDALRATNSTQAQQLLSNEHSLSTLKADTTQLAALKTQLQQQIETLRTQESQGQKTISGLQATLEARQAEATRTSAEATRASAEIAELKAELEKSRTERAALASANQQLQQEKTTLTLELKTATTNLSNAEKAKVELSEKVAQLQAQLAQRADVQGLQQNEIAGLKAELKAAQSTIEDLRIRERELQATHNRVNETMLSRFGDLNQTLQGLRANMTARDMSQNPLIEDSSRKPAGGSESKTPMANQLGQHGLYVPLQSGQPLASSAAQGLGRPSGTNKPFAEPKNGTQKGTSPFDKTINDNTHYLEAKGVISSSRLKAIKLMGLWIRTIGSLKLKQENLPLHDFLIASIKSLLTIQAQNLTEALESFIKQARTIPAGQFENSVQKLLVDLVDIKEPASSAPEAFHSRDLFKAMQNLFSTVGYDVPELNTFFEQEKLKHPAPAPTPGGAHSRAPSVDLKGTPAAVPQTVPN